MGSEGRGGLLDSAIEMIARALDGVGLNGTRVRWKWSQRRRDLGEAGFRTGNLFRSARGRYKMCPSCRALVPRSAWRCSECGAGLAGVRAPGVGRLLSNVLPGATAVTGLLFLVNGLFFLLCLLAPIASAAPDGGKSTVNSLIGMDGGTLLRYGAGLGGLTFGSGEWFRLITPIFLHGGLLHIVFNSIVLLQLGPLVEAEYGTERFAFIYLATGIAGNLLAQFLKPQGLVVGASGAICGLVGVLLVFGARRGGAYGGQLKSLMAQNALFILMMSLLPGISLLSHLGGFLGGCALGAVVPWGAFRNRGTALVWEAFSWVSVSIALYAFLQMARHGMEAVRLFG